MDMPNNDWSIHLQPGAGEQIIVGYQAIYAGLEQVNQILGEVETGIQDLQSALGLLHEVDQGRAATGMQEASAKKVADAVAAQQQLRGGCTYLDGKTGEFSEAESRAMANLGQY